VGPYVLSDKMIPLLSCAVKEPNSPTAAFCDRAAHSSAAIASPEENQFGRTVNINHQ